MNKATPIAVFTGTRAEYGLLYWLLKDIQAEAELRLIVSGAHLVREFGYTVSQIEADGFSVADRVDMLLASDTAAGVTKSMGLAMIGLAEAFERQQPELLVLLGDRYETFCAAAAATIANIPIAHIHGGEVTEGAYDDAFRHSISKMAQLHFTSTEAYRRRVIQLGEQPRRVFTVGAMTNDYRDRLELLGREALQQSIGLTLGEHNILVTYHPVTTSPGESLGQMQNLLSALDRFDQARILFTYPNADNEGRQLIGLINDYAARNPERVVAHPSLGQLRYLSALKHMNAVVGNSSSGLLEAPGYDIATVNIGIRQKGRLRGASVIDCESDAGSIEAALRQALSTEFQSSLANADNPYAGERPAAKIMSVLKTVEFEALGRKAFHDIEF